MDSRILVAHQITVPEKVLVGTTREDILQDHKDQDISTTTYICIVRGI